MTKKCQLGPPKFIDFTRSSPSYVGYDKPPHAPYSSFPVIPQNHPRPYDSWTKPDNYKKTAFCTRQVAPQNGQKTDAVNSARVIIYRSISSSIRLFINRTLKRHHRRDRTQKAGCTMRGTDAGMQADMQADLPQRTCGH
jgi:hypothetical protein